DYKGDTVSTIGEEKAFNPRLQVDSMQEYVDIMGRLDLPNPRMMDVAVPANLHLGLDQETPERAQWTLDAETVIAAVDSGDGVLVDLRDRSERERHGVIPGSVHAPYPDLDEHIASGGLLKELVRAGDRRLIFYCAFGERSSMAAESARAAGLAGSCHLKGGLKAWRTVGGPLDT
ncbi:MAG: MBL fold metallo-hydrolase, partial [Hyphomicrobiales bacterium]|nr:MBL fold metallo-hydrolase [Hyphomicrobiales bacterium]